VGVADSSRSSWRLRAAHPVKGDQVLAVAEKRQFPASKRVHARDRKTVLLQSITRDWAARPFGMTFRVGSSAESNSGMRSRCFAFWGHTCTCRKAYRLAYRSQRETPRDRALSGAFALRRKLGADGGVGDYVTKPKGMHWRTFERAMERIDRAEGIVDGHKRKAIGHSNVRAYSGIRVAKSRTGAA
jgi:hypothetical protein